MKRIIIISAMLLAFVGASAQNGKAIYQKYSDDEGVSAVYISPAMFRLIGKIPDLKVEDSEVNLAPIIKSLSGMYIINSSDGRIGDALKKDVNNFVSTGKYELIMETKDSGETMRMYTVGTEDIVESLVMFSIEPDEATFICIDGKMKRDDLEKAIASKVGEE